MLEAAMALEAAIARIRKIGDSAMQKSESGADAAQKAFEDNPIRGGAMQSRDAAEGTLINDRARVETAQANLDTRRRDIQSNPEMKAINDSLEGITQRRKDLEAKSRIGGITPAEQGELDAATKREIELMAQRERLAQKLTEAERKQLDAINNGIAAREKENEKNRQRLDEDSSFNRTRNQAAQIIENSTRQADEARQRFINNPTDENRALKEKADSNLSEDRRRAQQLQDDLDNKRKQVERDPAVKARNEAISNNNQQLAAFAEKEATVGLTKFEEGVRANIQESNRRLAMQNNQAVEGQLQPERKAIDDQEREMNQRDRALRGRELGMNERDRFAKQFREGAGGDIKARRQEIQDAGGDPAAFLEQSIKNQMEQVAPMLKGFEEERQTAQIQGPSRKALQVSDVSTSQGAAELTRLLRGDDTAKDVNLAELRKQTQKFDALIEIIKQQNPGVLL
jgi:hypothetical protein